MATFIAGFCAVVLFLRSHRSRNKIGFLHPASGGGGGGERVLWVAIKALQSNDAKTGRKRSYVLYTKSYGGNTQPERADTLLNLVKSQFGIEIVEPLEFYFLAPQSVDQLNPDRYRTLTLLRQTVWSGVAMFSQVASSPSLPSVLIESVGIPFAYPLLSVFCGIEVIPYIHYPIISSDMLRRVSGNVVSYNNNQSITSSRWKTTGKVLYYHAFSYLYWLCGRFAHKSMANSSWTANHIRHMWGCEPTIVFPPCNVALLLSEAATTTARKPIIASVGQFRPEKNHLLQIESFCEALPRLPKGSQLVLAGGARGAEDENRVAVLKEKAAALGLIEGDNIKFMVSRPYSEIVSLLCSATIGLHTMTDEHFGIVVVEYLAAGALALAHNSAGPKMDIVVSEDIGRLATTKSEFADKMVELMSMTDDAKSKMRECARNHAHKFTDEGFGQAFVQQLSQ